MLALPAQHLHAEPTSFACLVATVVCKNNILPATLDGCLGNQRQPHRFSMSTNFQVDIFVHTCSPHSKSAKSTSCSASSGITPQVPDMQVAASTPLLRRCHTAAALPAPTLALRVPVSAGGAKAAWCSAACSATSCASGAGVASHAWQGGRRWGARLDLASPLRASRRSSGGRSGNGSSSNGGSSSSAGGDSGSNAQQRHRDGPEGERIHTGTVLQTTPAAPGAPPGTLRWGSYLSRLPKLELAAREAVDNILAAIGPDAEPQLAIVFVTADFGEEFDAVVPLLRRLVPSLKHVIGCSVRGHRDALSGCYVQRCIQHCTRATGWLGQQGCCLESDCTRTTSAASRP